MHSLLGMASTTTAPTREALTQGVLTQHCNKSAQECTAHMQHVFYVPYQHWHSLEPQACIQPASIHASCHKKFFNLTAPACKHALKHTKHLWVYTVPGAGWFALLPLAKHVAKGSTKKF
jgi:hypothetical protein